MINVIRFTYYIDAYNISVTAISDSIRVTRWRTCEARENRVRGVERKNRSEKGRKEWKWRK